MKNNYLRNLIILIVVFFLGVLSSQLLQKKDPKGEIGKVTNNNGESIENLSNEKVNVNFQEFKDKILFCSDPADTQITKYFLYTINPDGTGRTKLADFDKTMRHPAWSKDRSYIAYSSLDDNNKDKIFLMTTDGKTNKQLTFGESRDMFPSWSPDGKYIVYVSYRNNTPNLFVMDRNGKNAKQLTFVKDKDTALWPQWSPDGSVIVYAYNKEGEDIDFRLRTIKSDGTDDTELLSSTNKDLSDYDPAWSPDGKTLYFLSNRSTIVEIWQVDYEKLRTKLASSGNINYDEVGLKQISNLKSMNVSPDHRPRVSPDGKKIVFYGVGSDWQKPGTNLYVINIDGTNLTNITKSEDRSEWPDW